MIQISIFGGLLPCLLYNKQGLTVIAIPEVIIGSGEVGRSNPGDITRWSSDTPTVAFEFLKVLVAQNVFIRIVMMADALGLIK